MSTSNFNLRGIPSEVMSLLKREAKENHISINFLILKIIEQSLGFNQQTKRTRYHDLDNLAGTWSAKEGSDFEENIKFFDKIDSELWQ
jgi:hypothetical protein